MGQEGGRALMGGDRDRMGCSARRNEPQAPNGDTERPPGALKVFSFPPVHGVFPIKPHVLLKPLWRQREPQARGWRVTRGGTCVTAPPQSCSEQRCVCLLWQPQDKPPHCLCSLHSLSHGPCEIQLFQRARGVPAFPFPILWHPPQSGHTKSQICVLLL